MLTLPTFADSSAAYQYVVDIDGTSYRLRFRWLERAKAWYMDILEPDGTEVLTGVRMVVTWSLTYRHDEESLPTGALVLVDTSLKQADIVHQAELGDERTLERCRLVYITLDEIEAALPASDSPYVVSVTI